MRLEPVLLVAPRAKPQPMTSRRAFLVAGGMFTAGTVLGGACGYTIGVAVGGAGGGGAAAAGAGEDELKTGDAELDELRRLAVKAPIEELVRLGVAFCRKRDISYPSDAILWRGIDRLARHLVQDPSAVDRSLLLVVCATIERGSPPAELRLDGVLPELNSLRKATRK